MPSVRAELAFSRPEDVAPDRERPGVLRGPDVDVERESERKVDLRAITARDCASLEDFTPDLLEHGFARADLSGLAPLQAVLDRIRSEGRHDESQVAAIRRLLTGRSLPLSGGRRLKILFVAKDGFILRRAGPNGMRIHADGPVHDGAQSVHADQDVRGTPLRQMMRGAAPWLFHHESPDGRNALSRLFLINLWIPLQQVTRPLALMDRRSLDRRRHQLRLGLKVDSFIERDEERAVNHIWSFLHDDDQRWYFASELGSDTAYAFETLSTPHGSFVLPGEDLAEGRYRRLDEAVAAVDARDPAALARALSGARPAPGDAVTAPLRRAIARMDAMLDEAAERAAALCRGEDASDWRARAARAQQRVVRTSLEMRALGVVTKDRWPFSRW